MMVVFIAFLVSALAVSIGVVVKQHRINVRLTQKCSHLVQLLNTDHRTGVRTVAYIDKEVEPSFDSCPELDYVLMVIDVDNFGQYNNTHGHLAGDRALEKVGEAICSSIRPEDIAGRIGGDEFIIAFRLDGKSKLINLPEIGDRINEHLNGLVTISFGYAKKREGEYFAQVKHRADQGLLAVRETQKEVAHTHKEREALSALESEAEKLAPKLPSAA